jgi:hypothetical protein
MERTRAGSKRWKNTRAMTSSDIGHNVETRRGSIHCQPHCKPGKTRGALVVSNDDAPMESELV